MAGDQRHPLGPRSSCAPAGATLALLLCVSSCSRNVAPTAEDLGAAPPTRSVVYALDGLPRNARRGTCPKVPLGEFAGQSLRFSPAARVTPAFRSHLVQLEHVVQEIAQRIYGRAPSTILVAASYDCRPVTRNQRRLSEHAFGNAIDIAGFRFPALPGSSNHLAQDGFDVRVDKHWKARGGAVERMHAHFLEELTRTLIERDVFRTFLGPAHPDHKDHFHFDMAPGRRFVHL